MKLFSSQIYHRFLRNRDFTLMYPTNNKVHLEKLKLQQKNQKSNYQPDSCMQLSLYYIKYYIPQFLEIIYVYFLCSKMETFPLFYAIHLTVKNFIEICGQL